VHVIQIKKVANDHFGSHISQALGALVFTMDHRTNLLASLQQEGSDRITHCADATGCTCDQNWLLTLHFDTLHFSGGGEAYDFEAVFASAAD
jgi:hypothetical protein